MVIFERLASLLLPAEGGGRIVETDERWRGESLGEGEVVVWGRPPLPSGVGFGAARRFAGDRRRALVRLRRRPPRGLRVVDSVWWMPPEIARSRVKQPLKNALAAGAALTLSPGERPRRVLDAAWGDAGLGAAPSEPRPSSGGSVRVEVDDESSIFRAGPAGSPVDPVRAAEGLRALEGAGIESVPRALRSGATAGAGWAVESRLSGTRPERLDEDLVAEVVELVARLPADPGPPRALEEDRQKVISHLPGAAASLDALLSAHVDAIAEMPGRLRHGDLWAGNLLVEEGRLRGVVDWDAWHPSGVPGTDLVHLLGTAEGARGSLGGRFARRFWLGEGFRSASAPYWEAVGVSPGPEVLDAIGVAWWVGQIAANLERLPHLAASDAWMDANVRSVLGL